MYVAYIEMSMIIGIELEPNNQTLWSALSACQQAYEADKVVRYAEAAKERAQEELRLNRREDAKNQAKQKKVGEEDLLNDFFSDVNQANTTSNQNGSAVNSANSHTSSAMKNVSTGSARVVHPAWDVPEEDREFVEHTLETSEKMADDGNDMLDDFFAELGGGGVAEVVVETGV
jgi:hypothetical protein